MKHSRTCLCLPTPEPFIYWWQTINKNGLISVIQEIRTLNNLPCNLLADLELKQCKGNMLSNFSLNKSHSFFNKGVNLTRKSSNVHSWFPFKFNKLDFLSSNTLHTKSNISTVAFCQSVNRLLASPFFLAVSSTKTENCIDEFLIALRQFLRAIWKRSKSSLIFALLSLFLNFCVIRPDFKLTEFPSRSLFIA